MKNWCYVHAHCENQNDLRIDLKFCDSTNKQSIYSETLIVNKDVKNEYKVIDILGDNILSWKETEQVLSPSYNGNITSLDLLKVVIPFTIADATCDTSFHGPHLANNAEAFGVCGKEKVLEFKEMFLGPQRLLGKPAYKLSDPFTVDLKEMKVTLGFECLIEKYLGKGTDYVYVDDKLLVKKIDVVRHSGKYTD